MTEQGWKIICRDPEGPAGFLGAIEDAYRWGRRRGRASPDDDDGHQLGLGFAVTAFHHMAEIYGVTSELRRPLGGDQVGDVN